MQHARSALPTRYAVIPLCVGLLVQAWVWRAGGYDSAWDDMAITAAFARTFADTGRIALTPSSEVVEGFSTPLWFFVLAASRKAFALDAHALYRTAQGLSSLLLDAMLLLLGSTVIRLCKTRREALWALAGLSLIPLWPPFVMESVNGMENPLIAFLLAWGAWWSGGRPLLLAGVAVLLVWLRVEGGLFVLPLALAGRTRRAFVTVAVAAAGAFVLQEVWRFAVFGELVPNTVLAKLQAPYSVPGTPRAVLAARIRYLPHAVPWVFLPVVAVVIRRWSWKRLREEYTAGGVLDPAVLGAIGSAAVLTLMVGREWGYPGRMIFPLTIVAVAGLIAAAARAGPPVVRAGIVLSCAALVGNAFWASDRSSPNGEVITVENYRVSTAVPLNRLAVMAGRDGLTVATPDVGGTSLFGPSHTIIDTGLLSNRRLAKDGYGALADEIFGERMVDVVDTHTVFTRVSGIREGRAAAALAASYVPVSLEGKVFYLHRRLFDRLPSSRITPVATWQARGQRRREVFGRGSTYSRLDLDLVGRFPTVYLVNLAGAPS